MAAERDDLRQRTAGERQVFAQPLGALVKRPPVVCEGERSVADAARIMRDNDVGSVVIVDSRSRPTGIVTTQDLVSVVAGGGADRPVAELMSRDPVALSPHAFAYEAALLMSEHGIRHVLVLENGRLAGVVSERDLFALQRLGLGELTMEIRLTDNVEALAGLARDIRRLAALLVEQGTAPEPLTLFISVLNDRLTQRVIEVTRKRHDLDRIRWSWLAFGSEGRLEQTFSTDQDNGIVFSAHGTGGSGKARERLVSFAREVNVALDACGFPLCEGNIMASNPALCLTLEEWKAKVSGWLEASVPQALLDAAIFFDLRPIYGDDSLAASLREWIAGRVRGHAAFLHLLAQSATQAKPPLGLLAGFAAKDAPGAPHSINLKANGARIFVDAARALALAKGVHTTNTAARLRAVLPGAGEPGSETNALIDAFYYIQQLRLRRQASAPEARAGTRAASEDLANRIDPDQLNPFEQSALKEAFRFARLIQNRLELDFRL